MNLEKTSTYKKWELKDCKNENDLCYFKRNVIQKNAVSVKY